MLMLSAKIHDECYLARIARSWFIVPILDFRLFLIRLGCGIPINPRYMNANVPGHELALPRRHKGRSQNERHQSRKYSRADLAGCGLPVSGP
jgi:hypothetical protein